MPRMSLNLGKRNVEQLEFSADQVREWINTPIDHSITRKIEIALDEAQLEIMEGGSDTEYVVIKVSK